MNIKTNAKIKGKVKAWVFSLCGCSVRNMTWLFIGVFLAEQGVSIAIEYLIWGEHFTHGFDRFFTGWLACMYFLYIHSLGDFLLDLTLNAERVNNE